MTNQDSVAGQSAGGAAEPVAARLPVIDAFRGMAALMVCAFHVRQIIWVGLQAYLHGNEPHSWPGKALALCSFPLKYGASAVPLFFVISGYCIHRSFAFNFPGAGGQFSSWIYYFVRRAWRIYPVFIGVLLLTYLLDSHTRQLLFPSPGPISLTLKTALLNLAGMQGILAPVYGSDGPLWSLSVELQLYAVYPVIFYLFRAWGIKRGTLMLLGFSFITAGLGMSVFKDIIWFGPFWFCWTVGVLIAEIEAGNMVFKIRWGVLPFWALISVAGFAVSFGRWAEFTYSFMGLFWGFIVLVCLKKGHHLALLSTPLRILAVLGVFSYSLYAVHEPVCYFIRAVFFGGKQTDNLLLTIPVVVGCIAVAFGLFILVERYSLRVPGWLQAVIRRRNA